jgi:hypothetical protein
MEKLNIGSNLKSLFQELNESDAVDQLTQEKIIHIVFNTIDKTKIKKKLHEILSRNPVRLFVHLQNEANTSLLCQLVSREMGLNDFSEIMYIESLIKSIDMDVLTNQSQIIFTVE